MIPTETSRATAAQTALAARLHELTGLTLQAALAWTVAENGPPDNILGLKDPATGTLAHIGDVNAQAVAYAKNLETPLYNSVTSTILSQPTDTAAQLKAIAESRWDANHYRGTGAPAGTPIGTTLLGAWAWLTHRSASGDSLTSPADWAHAFTSPGDDLKAAGGLLAKPLTGWVGDVTGWAGKEAPVALAYVAFVLLGIVFVIVGGLEVFGYSPARVARGVFPVPGSPGSRKPAKGEVIPF